jgi:deazaflavin-dependent oxidoreductase (nitroreductase family)
MPQILVVAVVALLGLVTLGVAFVLGMRARSPLVHRPIWWFSRRFINPRQMRTAGTPGAYAAIIRAPGRRSGRMYETPIGVVVADGSALVSLPYGTSPQWLRNVCAAGGATIVHEGRTFPVDSPEVIPMAEVAVHFASEDRSRRLLRVDQCLRLRIVGSADAAGTRLEAHAA